MPNPVRRRRLGGTSFNPNEPLNLASIALWQRGDSLALADSAAIATWADSSAAGNNATQGTGANQPIFNTGIVNGRPAVHFNGTSQQLSLANTFSGVNFTFLAVVYVETFADYRNIIGANTNGIDYYIDITTGKPTMSKSGVVALGGATTALTANTWYQIAATYNGATATYYLSGLADGSASTSQTFSSVATDIGGQAPVGAGLFRGYIAEVVAYQATYTSGQLAGLFNYFRKKYAVR